MDLESKIANYFISKTFYSSLCGYPFIRNYITDVPFGYTIVLIHHQYIHQLVNSVKAIQHLKLKVV